MGKWTTVTEEEVEARAEFVRTEEQEQGARASAPPAARRAAR